MTIKELKKSLKKYQYKDGLIAITGKLNNLKIINIKNKGAVPDTVKNVYNLFKQNK